jgi:uncharacterized protein YqeY
VAQEEAEMAVLQEYYPRQMTRDEIIVEARKIITEVGATGLSDRGKVMPNSLLSLKAKLMGGR